MRDHDMFLQKALLDGGRVTPDQIEEATRHARDQGVDLAEALVLTEALTSRDVSLVKADICEAPFVDVADYEICFENTRLIPRSVADRYCVFPLFVLDNVVTIGADDPLNLDAMDQVRQIVKCEVDAVLCDKEQLRALIARAYSLKSGDPAQPDAGGEIEIEAESRDDSQPVVSAVNQILCDAVEQGASDIHINPDEFEMRLRYRVDGVLHERQGPPLSMHAGIAQRLKVIGNLDLTQTRRPQDGKFRFKHNGEHVDVRMSTIPTVCGENIVLRLLTSNHTIQDFHELGIPSQTAAHLECLIEQPHGMVLVSGPTGSGKTTTLYTAIHKLNDPSKNIMTIEDPVEIRLPYVRQIQVNPEIGLSFASALRSILRQDPDIVLLGEIRDNETATIALQAALTGHFVLSTVHTNDAAGAVARLRNFDLPPFVINSAVLGVIAQRLVRRVCQHCVIPDAPSDLDRARFMLPDDADGFSRGKGCARCAQTGYRGRVGIYELLRFTPAIRRLVEEEASTGRLQDQARAEGMRLMSQDGLEKARLGLTTLEEVAKAATLAALGSEESELRRSA